MFRKNSGLCLHRKLMNPHLYIDFISDLQVYACLIVLGTLWAGAVAGSIAYNFRKPGEKMSVKIIHARCDTITFPTQPHNHEAWTLTET